MVVKDFTVALVLIWDRAVEIVKQPIINKEMLWILLPLVAALFLMEIYFGRYKREELGWNSAVSNSVILFFVGMNLLSFLYNKNLLLGLTDINPIFMGVAIKKTFIAVIILLESIFLIILNFFHLVSKRFAYGISSSLIMNYLGVVSIILIYSDILLDFISISAILFIFIITAVFFSLIRLLEPKVCEEKEGEEEEKEEEEELEQKEKEKIKKFK